jgi:5-methyltetrahydropteroyltriglutamate--homocysteine methyltransferase
MRRSAYPILTTHLGSPPLLDETGDLRPSVHGVDERRDLGIDVINEGEYTKGGHWLSFVESRFCGFEDRPRRGDELPLIAHGKLNILILSRSAFSATLRWLDAST